MTWCDVLCLSIDRNTFILFSLSSAGAFEMFDWISLRDMTAHTLINMYFIKILFYIYVYYLFIIILQKLLFKNYTDDIMEWQYRNWSDRM